MRFEHLFKKDLEILEKNLINKKHFSFAKFADGEFFILQNQLIRNIDNWLYNPSTDKHFSDLLMESLKYREKDYYIGISCPCCGREIHKWYMENNGSDYDNTTFANIFVNSNYPYYVDNIIPLYNSFKKIVLIANKESNLKKVKTVLNYTDFFGIGPEAFKTDLHLIDELKTYIDDNNIRDALFLFCSGPLGNILSYKLWEHNKNNTYLDIGSTLNPWTDINIREYQRNTPFSVKTCTFDL